MKTQKTWATIHFTKGEAEIELTLNYRSKSYTMSHDSNDENVTFNGDMEEIKLQWDRLKCVTAALKYVQQELS